MARNSYTVIENEAAYNDAISRRIKENARKGKLKRWLAEDASRPALIEALCEAVYGPKLDADLELLFADGIYEDEMSPADQARVRAWQKARNSHRVNPFLAKMHDSYMEWGSLTPGQEVAVRKCLDTDAARKAERDAQRAEAKAAEAATSTHIGTVGKREVFTLAVRNVMTFDGTYGTTFIHILHDAAGNLVVYKGTKRLAQKGETVTVKATVKDHGEREGVKQTILARPTAV
jgi:hypothetical protein